MSHWRPLHYAAFRDGLNSEKSFGNISLGGSFGGLVVAALPVISEVTPDRFDHLLEMPLVEDAMYMIGFGLFGACLLYAKNISDISKRVRQSLDEELVETARVQIAVGQMKSPRHAYVVGQSIRQLSFETLDNIMAITRNHSGYHNKAGAMLGLPETDAMPEAHRDDCQLRISQIMYYHDLTGQLIKQAHDGGVMSRKRETEFTQLFVEPYRRRVAALEGINTDTTRKLAEQLKPYGMF